MFQMIIKFGLSCAQLMMETYDLNEGVTITIDKDIPVSAGLAGGSADALLRCVVLIGCLIWINLCMN